MKKTVLFILSITVAFGITFYIKKEQSKKMVMVRPQWKTFVKTPDAVVAGHKSTPEEFQAARIPAPPEASKSHPNTTRSVSSVDPYKGFMVRNNRILMGEVDQRYEDEDNELKMVNSINPEWKDLMGNDLMRFQESDTKLMIKEEVPVIKIVDGRGRFLEQVTVTYLQKFGKRNSFKALVDSDTGAVVETWDRTIHEEIRRPRGGLILPSVNESGIITK